MTKVSVALDAGSLKSNTRILMVLFFCSGFPALVYQLVWQRALFRIFGVNIESVTIVVTAFMLGLGLGSLLGGFVSKRRDIPLLPLLAFIEFLTGIFGIFSLSIFDAVGTLTLGLPLATTACVTLALVIVPTLLMGATLPILVGHLAQRFGNVGQTVGKLYYVNTLGAGTACFIAAVLLFPFLGMQGSVYTAVFVNMAVAIGALAAFFKLKRLAPFSTLGTSEFSVLPPVLNRWPMMALSFLSGFVALSYEIFFFRTMSYGTGSMAMIFAITLSAFLTGLASGARIAGDACASSRDKAMSTAVNSLICANIVGVLFLPLLAHLGFLGNGVLGICILMIFLMARFLGAILPSLAHFGVKADAHAGMETACLYLVNILGSTLGSILTGFVLMDKLGLIEISRVLIVLGILSFIALITALPLPRRDVIKKVYGAVILGIIAVLLLPSLSSNILESLLWKGSTEAAGPFVDVVENRSGILTVDQKATVYGTGIYDGKFNIDIVHDTNGIFRPYALSLYNSAPRDVLIIGLASGSWAQVLANNPEVKTLTVVEINPGYAELIAKRPEVSSLLKNPKVTFIVDDGRRWLHLNPNRKFDAVLSNTTWHFRSNSSNLLSMEFFELIKQHLNPGGTFFYNTTSSERAMRTGCMAFPHGARLSNHMIASVAPVEFNFKHWLNVLKVFKIDGNKVIDPKKADDKLFIDKLSKTKNVADYNAKNGTLTSIEPCPSILAKTAGLEPITDDNMGTEWRYNNFTRVE